MVRRHDHRPVLWNQPQEASKVLVNVQHFVAVFIRYRPPFVPNLVRSGKVGCYDVVSIRGEPLFQQVASGLISLVIIGMALKGIDEFNLIMASIHVAHHITPNHPHGILIGIGGEQPWVGASGMAHVEILEAVNRSIWYAGHHLSNTGGRECERPGCYGEDGTLIHCFNQIWHHGGIPHDVLTHAIKHHQEVAFRLN